MRNSRISVVTVGLIMATAVSALGFAGELKAFLRAELPKSKRAFESKNIGYFHAVSTPDFSYTDIKGTTQKKKEALAGLKMMLDGAKTIKVDTTLGRIQENANGGTCEVTQKFDMMMMPGPDKKSHRMQMSMTTKERWVKSGKSFKLQKIVETKVGQMLMDGKPMDPSAMGGG